MRSGGKAHTLRGLAALALVVGVGGGCFALGIEFEQKEPGSCKTNADCDPTNECGERACKGGFCEVTPKPAGTRTPTQTVGDCKLHVCDGKGNIVTEPNDKDTLDDGNPCTIDKCVDGTLTFASASTETPCGVDGQLRCNGAGTCFGCMDPSQCGKAEDCATWTCMTGSCAKVLKAEGTFVADMATADCKASFCDAVGQVVVGPYASDTKDDGNECTTDACSNGSETHEHVPNGTLCGSGCQMCVDGACDACSKLPDDYACDDQAMQCTPLKKLENGSACASVFDCASENCIDGVCCDTVCDGPCMACTIAKTGQPNGTCSPITAGTDPDNECQSPEADVCDAGKCQCFNGIKDGTELKIDCGGNCKPCTGTWQCDGMPACDGAQNAQCCTPFCDVFCAYKADSCKALHGSACTLGEADKEFPIGTKGLPECTACRISVCKCK
ncbi:hypothetical protein [Polyangium aurulentum]|uniref:hypothetical protein n=1 Tax=Polyangium aurulentum TaxID=2567896 RepID=UPI0010AE8931|nr:hypothetical protein [Polyangium aurulentum]UQA58468.1 hypothetical protein E8A73_045695 [Polyangium aurulentum]